MSSPVMLSHSYLYCLITVSVLWTLWGVALCWERRWLRDAWRRWSNMPPCTKAVMAALCAFCTVTAQKPGNTNNAAVSGTPFAGNATNPASPVCFTNTGTLTVRTLMLAARGDAADLATLADAPETARLRLVSDGSRQTEPGTVEQSLTRQFLPGCWRVVALDFESPAVLAGITFGGSAGRPEWFRNWRGEVAEIVGFDAPPGADLRAGVANYLALRWGFGGYPAASAQRDAAVAAGLRHYGLVWNLVLFLR